MHCELHVVRNANYDNKPVSIDGFTIADFDGSSNGFVSIGGCPDPTPTPTPQPPEIRIDAVLLDYDYDGDGDEVEATIEVTLV